MLPGDYLFYTSLEPHKVAWQGSAFCVPKPKKQKRLCWEFRQLFNISGTLANEIRSSSLPKSFPVIKHGYLFLFSFAHLGDILCIGYIQFKDRNWQWEVAVNQCRFPKLKWQNQQPTQKCLGIFTMVTETWRLLDPVSSLCCQWKSTPQPWV